MSLRDLADSFPEVVEVLKKAGFTSESDLKSLDPADLQELFPGLKTLQTRRDLFNKFHPEQSGDSSSTRSEAMKKINALSPIAAQTLEDSGCLDYLELLDRRDLMELFPRVEDLKWRQKIFEIIHLQMPVDDSKQPVSKADKFFNRFKGGNPLHTKEVCYQKLDSGKCLKVSKMVLKKVTNNMRVRFKETTTDHKVSLLFCPVITRIGSDAEIAIASIKDDKPVILVFLIHTLKPQSLLLHRFEDERENIVLSVPLFHHETKSGLLRCKENDSAIGSIQKKLLEYSKEITPDQDDIDHAESCTERL